MGGSFNPIHNGHLAVAQGMVERNIVDEVWLMVSPQNPLKSPASLLPETVRLEMAKSACEGMAGIEASDFEFSLPRPSYTWQTLCALTEKFPDRQFHLLIGADNWGIFGKWYRSEDILRNFRVDIYPRSGHYVSESRLPPGVTYVEMPAVDVSSTLVRSLVKQGKDFSALVPEKVYEKIIRGKLYGQH